MRRINDIIEIKQLTNSNKSTLAVNKNPQTNYYYQMPCLRNIGCMQSECLVTY